MDVDTIAAVSTAPGTGAIGVVRVSGARASEILSRVAPGLGQPPTPRSATLVEIVDPDDGSPIDRGLALYFPGPGSYTGEDVVEISCHGGWLQPGLVLDACVRAGAREAEAGEFTRRAYLNGKVDLIQAEAIADLIQARSRAFQRAALGQLERGLSRRVAAAKEELVGVEALLVHHIDFPEEDDPPVPLSRVIDRAVGVISDLDALLATAPEGELMREGALVVLAGRPNVGKSSLYNALLGEERAIVTEQPGTTRDALHAHLQIGGFPFRLVDTAGLRDASERVERVGIEVAQRHVDAADIVLFCVPTGEEPTAEDRAFLEQLDGRTVLRLETMADLGDAVMSGERVDPTTRDQAAVADTMRVSTVTGQGLDRLKELLPVLAYRHLSVAAPEDPVLTARRQARGVRVARDEVTSFVEALSSGVPAEVAATHLRSAESALEGLLGLVSMEEVLDVVFRQFCVGK